MGSVTVDLGDDGTGPGVDLGPVDPSFSYSEVFVLHQVEELAGVVRATAQAVTP